LIVQGEGVRVYLFILIFFIVEGEGVEVNVFFSPSFDMWKEEGVNCFLQVHYGRHGLGLV
jgi:hypothetical protein